MKSFYFLIADHVNHFEDSMIYIAEGLKDLGITFYSNKNLWKDEIEGGWLFNFSPEVSYQDCDVVVMSYTWFEYLDPETYEHYEQNFPKDFFSNNRKYKTVYLDPTDGYKTRSWEKEFRNFDLILRAKYNKYTYNPDNVKPWILGYSNRIIKATSNSIPYELREKRILQNFNFTHIYTHGLREIAKEKFTPLLEKRFKVDKSVTDKDTSEFSDWDLMMWNQTAGKHHPLYYQKLKNSIGNLCFCGELIPYFPKNPSLYMKGGNKAAIIKNIYLHISSSMFKKQRIIQWDSWRFWETLCAGTVAIHIDLEKYGVELPIMPTNWKHYIGIDLRNIKKDIERIFDEPDLLKNIGSDGREWALNKYSQENAATILIKYISLI